MEKKEFKFCKEKKGVKNEPFNKRFKESKSFSKRKGNSKSEVKLVKLWDDEIKLLKNQKKERRERKEKITIEPEVLEKYDRGEGISKKINKIKNDVVRNKILQRESNIEFAVKQSARTEVLLGEVSGFIEAEEGEVTRRFSQHQIKKEVDITSAAKQFELDLAFGPYRLDYTRNGRFLLLGGKRGHVAAMDWVTKKLMCEFNVMEAVYDVQWLHIETMFAAAQKEWLYIYSNQGIELHCMKAIHRPLRMTFLPYHFLLATSNEKGFLHWLDVSVGKLIKTSPTHKGRLAVLTQNPYNAVLCVGHHNGTVSMWSPNVDKPLVSMMCHKGNVNGVAVDMTGKYMATCSSTKEVKIWDVRKLEGPLQNYRLSGGAASEVTFSQRGLLALSINNVVEIYKDLHQTTVSECYLRNRLQRTVFDIKFSPFEDVLGVGTVSGFTSMLIPGAGEANFDSLECNPVGSKKQRQETEVKSLLEKIQPEMISLDPTDFMNINQADVSEVMETKRKLATGEVPKLEFIPRNRKRTLTGAQVKQIVKGKHKKQFLSSTSDARRNILKETGMIKEIKQKKKKALDRFLTKLSQKQSQ